MNEETTIYKAQQKALINRSVSGTATALIVGGGALLVANLAGFSLLEFLAPLLFMGGFGVLLLQPAYHSTADQQSKWSWLAVPGAFFLTLGTLIFLMNLVDHFESFAYAWTLLPAAVVAGMMYVWRFDELHPIHERGYKIIRFLVLLFIGLGAFFELLVFETLGPWWPLLLIGAGIYLARKERS